MPFGIGLEMLGWEYVACEIIHVKFIVVEVAKMNSDTLDPI